MHGGGARHTLLTYLIGRRRRLVDSQGGLVVVSSPERLVRALTPVGACMTPRRRSNQKGC